MARRPRRPAAGARHRGRGRRADSPARAAAAGAAKRRRTGARPRQAQTPPPMTRALLVRGQERYSIYCLPCHSPLGDGDGPVARHGFPHPPTLPPAAPARCAGPLPLRRHHRRARRDVRLCRPRDAAGPLGDRGLHPRAATEPGRAGGAAAAGAARQGRSGRARDEARASSPASCCSCWSRRGAAVVAPAWRWPAGWPPGGGRWASCWACSSTPGCTCSPAAPGARPCARLRWRSRARVPWLLLGLVRDRRLARPALSLGAQPAAELDARHGPAGLRARLADAGRLRGAAGRSTRSPGGGSRGRHRSRARAAPRQSLIVYALATSLAGGGPADVAGAGLVQHGLRAGGAEHAGAVRRGGRRAAGTAAARLAAARSAVAGLARPRQPAADVGA